jgi:hypothetical protein
VTDHWASDFKSLLTHLRLSYQLAPNEASAMMRDMNDVIGILMRILGGGEVSHEELDDLAFEADGELETALNEAYVKLREFANDHDLRLNDPKMDRGMRSELKDCLDNIVKASNSASQII